MMLELVLLDGTDRRLALAEGCELTVGSSSGAALRLSAIDVSRSHALVTCQRGKVTVLDLGSTNGTFVNGKRVKESELSPGDVVRFSSVIGQVLPPAGVPGAEHEPVPSATGKTRAAVKPELASPTSDRVPVILQESLAGLLVCWSEGGTAVASLVEWLVAHRGMRAAAVLEWVTGEVAVVAAHGALRGVLTDPACTSLVRSTGRYGPTLETEQLELGGHDVLAVNGAGMPLVLLLPGVSMPDSAEIELYIRLLAVARRLDATIAVRSQA